MRVCKNGFHSYDESKKRQCPKCKRIADKIWDKKNSKLIVMRAKIKREGNRAKSRAVYKKYRDKNRAKYNGYEAKYRAARLNRTPKWLSQDQLLHIQEHYDLAAEMSREYDAQIDVDHVIPLRGVNVSGLHVPWNLQLMARSANSAKGNRNGF